MPIAFFAFVIKELGTITIELFLFVLGIRWFAVEADRKRTEKLFMAGLFASIATFISLRVAAFLSNFCRLKYDLYAYWVSARFLGEPSFYIGRMAGRHLWLQVAIDCGYGLPAAMMLGTFAVYLWLRPDAEAMRVIELFILNPLLALPIYLMFPVCGPAYAFPGFPYHVPSNITPHPMTIDAAPNGIPSVHTSTALLVLWLLRHWWWGRAAGGLFLVLTVLATLGLGEHYLIDLVLAAPYTALVLWLAKPRTARKSDLLAREKNLVAQSDHATLS
jgi:hypothetical protein